MSTASDANLWAIVRTFKAGAVFDLAEHQKTKGKTLGHTALEAISFPQKKVEETVVAPIKKLLDSASPKLLKGILVFSCGDPQSSFCEEVNALGDTPTTQLLRKMFPREIKDKKIIPIVITQGWGLNAGSVTPLNQGIAIARKKGASRVLMWSPEIDLDGPTLLAMKIHMDTHKLKLVGCMREHWQEKIQWKVAQNTIALWDIGLLTEIGGVRPDCNGNDVEKIEIPNMDVDGKADGTTRLVRRAGMEDFDTYIRANQNYQQQTGSKESLLPWGTVGDLNPLPWKLSYVPGTKPYKDNQDKMARQEGVMTAYLKKHLGDDVDIAAFYKAMFMARIPTCQP